MGQRDGAPALLKSNGKRKADTTASAKSKTPRVVAQGSSFAPCPLCNKSVPKALLHMHVNSCEREPLAHTIAPHEGEEAHAPTCQDNVGMSASPAAEQPVSVQSAQSVPAAAAQCPPQPAGHSTPRENAFARLMRQQRERSQTWTFFLGARPDGSFFWHIWRDNRGSGSAPDQEIRKRLLSGAQWSATSQAPLAALECQVSASSSTKSPPGKVALKLVTSIAPGPAGDIGPQVSGGGPPSRAPWEYTGSASLVKSALQKNVRRWRHDEAVRCAAHLLARDPSGLLRRVCIIALEDALLHPQLPLLVWLMAAVANGFLLDLALRGACLSIVRDLARVPVQDSLPTGSQATEEAEGAKGTQGLAPACACWVTCMLLRAAYGGMGGDVAMLKGFARLWLHRFQSNSTPPPLYQMPGLPRQGTAAQPQTWPAFLEEQFAVAGGSAYGADQAGPLQPWDIPASAVDFHVSSIVEELLARPAIREAAASAAAATGRDAADCLRTAMWLFRSCLNMRWHLEAHVANAHCTEDAERRHLKRLWSVARADVETWAESYIRARFRAVKG